MYYVCMDAYVNMCIVADTYKRACVASMCCASSITFKLTYILLDLLSVNLVNCIQNMTDGAQKSVTSKRGRRIVKWYNIAQENNASFNKGTEVKPR